MKTHTGQLKSGHARRGFTMLEITFAIMVLGVGLIAVASLFPVAIQVQKSTFDDMMSQQVAYSAKAMLQKRGILASDLDLAGLNNDYVHRIPLALLDNTEYNGPNGTASIEWIAADRSFPTTIKSTGVDDNGNGIDDGVEKRTYFWEPLIRWDGSQWEVFIVVFKRVLNRQIPSISHGALKIGEMGAHQNDGSVVVRISSPVNGWHAEPAGDSVTTLLIIKAGPEVVR